MAKGNNNLVIVESPAKAKTIGKYLGPGFFVTASMGHLRDLPKSTLGVDVDDGFTPHYQPVKGREAIIKELKAAVKKSSKVYLATDPDREGEAIAWHLKELLGLSDENAFRVSFNEITKKVVQSGIENPRPIDNDLVDAQQARRILDRIVGYKLSPLLWKKIRRGLSAGRVQSVATRMVTDREAEIAEFKPEEYWLLNAELIVPDGSAVFTAAFHGSTKKKMELTGAEDVAAVVDAVKSAPFSVRAVKRTNKKRSASPPFITSSLQQEASRKLGMTPRKTMSVAQQIYEGVEVSGEGTVGLITYMRTDSFRISNEAASEAKAFIISNYGENYYPQTPNIYKSKNTAQEAHEAIRPSDVSITPEKIKSSVTSDQYRLYRLIWNRFVASQMAQAVYDSVTVDCLSADYIFRANHTAIIFPGFSAVYDETEEKEEKKSPLPDLREDDPLGLKNILQEQKFTQPPPRYTEASLIRAMEETGVGRPSTYAPTISTILNREYVVKDGKVLRPTPLGIVVTDYMKDRFADIVDLKFTARMEELLDSIEKGKDDRKNILNVFYAGLKESLDSAESDPQSERIKIPDEISEEKCELCGKFMVIKFGRFGRFLACPGYPECTFTMPLVIEMPGKCPKCGQRILKRTSKNGYTYYACEKLKECGFITWDVPVADNCPECGQTQFKLSGKGARKPFCINEKCQNFLPEDKRGYRKKKEDNAESGEKDDSSKTTEQTKSKKAAAKKSTTGKTGAKKKTTSKTVSATKKTAVKTTGTEKKTTSTSKTPTTKKAASATKTTKTAAAKKETAGGKTTKKSVSAVKKESASKGSDKL